MKIAIYETSPFNKIEGLNEKEINLPTPAGNDDGGNGGNEGGGNDDNGTGQIRITSDLGELGNASSGPYDPNGTHESGWKLWILYIDPNNPQTVVNERIVEESTMRSNSYYDFTDFVENNGTGIYVPTLLYENFGSGGGIKSYYVVEGYRTYLHIKPLTSVVGDISPWTPPGLVTLSQGDTFDPKTGLIINDVNSQVDLKFTETDESANSNWT